MKEFDQVLATATAQVGAQFFCLPIAGQSPAYRERVYCYELYHQMRLIWPCGPFTLNGEVDKAGHPILRQVNAARFKPDLLVHVPGDMSGNFAVMEVKPCNAPSKGIRKDVETLRRFSRDVGYTRAIYLIYGHTADTVVQRIQAYLAEDPFPELELWLHRETGVAASRLENPWGAVAGIRS